MSRPLTPEALPASSPFPWEYVMGCSVACWLQALCTFWHVPLDVPLHVALHAVSHVAMQVVRQCTADSTLKLYHRGTRTWAGDSARTIPSKFTWPTPPLTGHQADVDCLTWHPNFHLLASGSTDSTVRVWDLRTGACVRCCLGHVRGVTCLAASRDGQFLASGDDEGTLLVWDMGTGKSLQRTYAH